MSLHEMTRWDAERDEEQRTVEYMFSDGVFITLDKENGEIEQVYICADSIHEITSDLDADSAEWEQRRRWYAWLATMNEEPSGCQLDGEGLTLFVQVYGHKGLDWVDEVPEQERLFAEFQRYYLERMAEGGAA